MTKPSVDRALVMEIVRTSRTPIVADHIGGLLAMVSARNFEEGRQCYQRSSAELIARQQTKQAYGIGRLRVTAFNIP